MRPLSYPRRFLGGIMPLALMLAAVPAAAQQTQPPAAPAQAADTTTPRLVSPGTALWRSFIVPGWGQASAHAYKRGGIFFGMQSASWYMLLKTLAKLGDARDVEARRVAFISDSLRTAMAEDTILANELQDPLKFRERVDNAPTVVDIRKLIDSRKEQRQDWITYTLFLTLASGVDAFVAAQLADFPPRIETRPAPRGGLEFQVIMPLPRKP